MKVAEIIMQHYNLGINEEFSVSSASKTCTYRFNENLKVQTKYSEKGMWMYSELSINRLLESEVEKIEKTYSYSEAFDKIQYKEYEEMTTIDEDMVMFLDDRGLMTIDWRGTKEEMNFSKRWKKCTEGNTFTTK